MSEGKRQVTQIEMEMMVDQYAKAVPAQLQLNVHTARILWSRYKELQTAGFTADEALKIVCARPIIDV